MEATIDHETLSIHKNIKDVLKHKSQTTQLDNYFLEDAPQKSSRRIPKTNGNLLPTAQKSGTRAYKFNDCSYDPIAL